jgi:hypothetical protein
MDDKYKELLAFFHYRLLLASSLYVPSFPTLDN